jgi:N4-gp56 family major capsid protein
MSNETTTSTLNDLLPTIISEAMFIASERSIMRNLVRNYTVPRGNGKTVNVPIYSAMTAVGVAEGTDLVNNAVSTGTAILTIAEAGIMTTVTDVSVNVSASNVVADIGRLFGEAIARKMDQDLTALFSGFTTTVVGSNSTAMTAAHIFQAVAKLRALGVPSDQLVCVVNPLVAYDLKANLTATYTNPNAGDLQNEAMRSGYVGTIGGVRVFETSNVVDSTGDSVGGLFHRDALGLALLQDIKIELQRDASLRATELVATAVYGVGELYDGYGVAMSFDSSLVS